MTYETIKVRTMSRLYRGAKLELSPGVFRRVVREGASIARHGQRIVTECDVEPTLVCVGDYTIDAEQL